MSVVRTGLDRMADEAVARLVRGRRIGLLAHPASVDRYLVHARVRLADAGAKIEALFGPEHGFGGEAQDMEAVEGEEGGRADALVPVYSLYGQREEELTPRSEQLSGLDALVIDLQDVGSRYYTYVWTAALCLKAAAEAGVSVIALDRPNPLGGDRIEGAPQRPGYRSFVGLYDVPVRHGMTLLEILGMVREVEGIDRDALIGVEMQGWERSFEFDATGLPWVLPSPNMPTLDTARVYPGGCLLEGTNLSEGRGTTRPFEVWGAPYLDGAALAEEISIDGAILRPLRFQPMFQKHAGARCGGVQVHVVDRDRFRPYEAYVRLLAAVRRLCPEGFGLRPDAYEFVTDRPALDLLAGGSELRTALGEGDGLEEWLDRERQGAASFMEQRRRWLRY
jgi:uncharacterized protein YbbC (DUF1343 family)